MLNYKQKWQKFTDENGNQILDEQGNPVKVENKKATNPSNLDLLLADFAARVATGASIEEASIESTKNAIAREVSKDLIKKISLDNQNLQNGIAVANDNFQLLPKVKFKREVIL